MNKPIYQVQMSTDGNHKVTVTIEDPGGTDAALAWAKATHAKLIRNERPVESETEVTPEMPQCAIHQVPMVRMQGKLGPFWSCHQKNSDGGWCSYKPGR